MIKRMIMAIMNSYAPIHYVVVYAMENFCSMIIYDHVILNDIINR